MDARRRFGTELISAAVEQHDSSEEGDHEKAFGKVNSDPIASARRRHDIIDASATVKTMKRSNTVGCNKTMARHAIMYKRVFELSPQMRVSLHKLHEEKIRESCTPQARCLSSSAINQRTPLDIWRGGPGSWQIRGEICLENAKEEPSLTSRGFELVPRSAMVSAKYMLSLCGIGAVNTKGSKSEDCMLPGQDNFSVCRLNNGWELFIVADGHGIAGEWPATKAIQVLPNILQGDSCTKMLSHGEVKAALMLAFQRTQQFLEEDSPTAGIMLELAGCTLVCALRHPQHQSLWVASVGDSRAVLIVAGEGVVERTRDHKPSVAQERKRIEESGGEVISEEIGEQSMERVFVLGESYPGLAMTRSLGDTIVKDCGVICEPEVVEWRLQGRPGAVLLIATDGLWDFLSTEKIESTVLQLGKSRQKIAEELLSISRHAWVEETAGDYIDDITLLLVPLDGASTRPFTFAHSCQCLDGLSTLLSRRRLNSAS